MKTVNKIEALRKQVQEWRSQGLSIAFVPTMGNLHAGHLQLVKQAKARCQRVVVSIFVNPTQFGIGEDLSAYPRTLQQDQQELEAQQCDLLFHPDEQEMYSPPNLTTVSVHDLSGQLCGEFRPGHFEGVATVVSKLFNCVQPDVAVFGEKDYQQLLLIKMMVNDLKMPIDIVGVSTQREADGLALSSRNQYLSPEQRQLAPMLNQALSDTAQQLQHHGLDDLQAIEQQQTKRLTAAGFNVQYFTIRDADDLMHPHQHSRQLVVLTAASLGKTRLIDNLLLQ